MKSLLAQNISRIRRIKGFSQKYVTEKAKISRQALSALEKGKAEPKSSTLLALSNVFGVKINEFFAPIEMADSVRFRIRNLKSIKEQEIRTDEIIKITSWLKQYNFLEQQLDVKHSFDFLNIENSDPKEASKLARIQLNLNQNDPINDIVSLLEHHGIKIFSHDPNIDKYYGMSIGINSGGPLIAINTNSNISTERKIFTFAHEFGHLILHKNSYKNSFLKDKEEEENTANIFASYFLMPERAFLKKFDETKGLYWIDRILHIKRIFKVSYKTVIKRLNDLGIKDQNIYQKFAGDYKKRYRHDLKNYYEPLAIDKSEFNIDIIPDRFNNLVRMAYEKDIISESKAAELLNLTIIDFEHLKSSWSYIDIKG